MVILTPLIQARRTDWTKSDTLLLLAHATQAQDLPCFEHPLARFVRWTGRCCLYPLGDICYNFLDVAGYNS